MIEGNCPQCGEPIHPGADQAKFNRNLGVHLRARHGIKGTTSERYEASKRGSERAQRHKQTPEERKAYMKRYREMKKKGVSSLKHVQTSDTNMPNVVPAACTSCPNCGTRFYMAIPGQQDA